MARAPILYLAGGPGDAASSDFGWWLGSALALDHNIILFDQRGTGQSRPSLNCPEFDDSAERSRVAECRTRLVDSGINLSAYSRDASAQDILDLAQALELHEVNLYGASYGSRLALQIARAAPHLLRSIVLDGVYPFGVNALEAMAANTQRAFERLFGDCKADSSCHDAYPLLQEQFERTFTTLTAEPVVIDGALPDTKVLLNGDDFVLLLRSLVEDASHVRYLPALIAAYGEGEHDYMPGANLFVDSQDSSETDSHSEGAFLSAFCSDDAAATSSSRVREAGGGTMQSMSAITDAAIDLFADCELWNVAPSTAITELLPAIDVPTLLLSGVFDPVTPPHWAELAAREMSASWHIIFPAAGHGVLEGESCAESVKRGFLFNPTVEPRADCLEDLRSPVFHIRKNSGG